MNDSTLRLEKRNAVGGGKANRLRKNGYVPAVVYGHGIEPVPAQINASELRTFLSKNGNHSVFTTEFAAEHDFSVLVKDMQYDPVRKEVIHVDFQKVSMNEKVNVDVPIRIIGRNRVEEGGLVVVHQLDDVTVECLPGDVPHHIDADITGMSAGHSITAGQLKLPPGVALLTDPNSVILAISGGKHDLEVEKVDEKVVPEGEEGEVKAKRV